LLSIRHVRCHGKSWETSRLVELIASFVDRDPKPPSVDGLVVLFCEAIAGRGQTMRHNPWNLTRLRAVVVLAVATIFVVSLTQIAFVVDGSDRGIERFPVYGLELLITGLFSVFDDNPFKIFIWMANPVLIVTWILYLRGRRSAALITALTALGLTLCFLSVESVLGPGPAGVNVEDFEMRTIIAYGTGYWLWVASAAVLVAGVTADKIISCIMGR
jgi:hypothetical protein